MHRINGIIIIFLCPKISKKSGDFSFFCIDIFEFWNGIRNRHLRRFRRTNLIFPGRQPCSVLFCLSIQKQPFTRFIFLVLCGFSAGLCFMIKGFLAFAVLTSAAIPFLIWEKQWKKIFTMPWIPALSATAICIPWEIKIWEKAPDFWPYFIIVEHYNRFFKAKSFEGTGMHPESFWFFIPIVFVGILPWTIHLLSAILGLRDKAFLTKPVYPLQHCMAGIPIYFLLGLFRKAGYLYLAMFFATCSVNCLWVT